MKIYQALVGGQWKVSSSERFLPSYNPYNQEEWAQIPLLTNEEISEAVECAHRSFKEWKNMSGLDRATLLHRLSDLIEEHADYLAEIESTDNGKVIRETKNQILFTARNYRYFAGYADKLLGEAIPLDNRELLDYTIMEPIGVVALITAWNSPLPLLANKLAPALATGNTVVIKPSEHASISTLEFARLIEKAGFPAGVVNVVTGDGKAGDALIRHPLVGKVSFTGGTQTAQVISRAVSEKLIPITLELGGKSPNIIFEDADIDEAVIGAVAGIFGASGQTCIAGSRLLVQRSILEIVKQALVEKTNKIKLGNPLDSETEMGPVANINQFNKIIGMIEEAKNQGAILLCGGKSSENSNLKGFYIEPTIFYTENPKVNIACEEVFGPVLTILPFDSVEEAIHLANDSVYGLAAGIWTRDIKKAHRLAQQIEAGTVWINTYRTSQVGTPFGGIKQSGFGRERSWHTLYEYTHMKNIMVNLSDNKRDPFSMQTK
ncbi:aldehyde dehydrogenase [Robertmurraya yapensis]|uniref:Aldehyde dehydrogenase n=1 Tax=Bacillus yapensis TaxID=2492960 RepID=A0A431WIH1_9BACI|nr:aldehyde dehydrogenase [Bacillus yapensis]RTR35170.1 aldehyde dehydrogenase [Bacillus yapensis]TKS97679.1 aldehyde dehydrogenase family protein [Bacillus yapensis]